MRARSTRFRLGCTRRAHRTARQPKQPSTRRVRLRHAFDKYGVPGVSLVGQTLLPSQITSVAMVSFGAPKKTPITLQVISIILWGTVFGSLATLGVNLLGTR